MPLVRKSKLLLSVILNTTHTSSPLRHALLNRLHSIHLAIQFRTHGINLKSAEPNMSHDSELPFPNTSKDIKVTPLEA